VRAPHIVVVGSANVDLTTITDAFPRPGETIFGTAFHLGFGGKGANQAVAASLCGARVTMIARVGDDLFGPAYIENLKARGVDTAYVKQTPGVSTGVAPIFVDSAGQNRILVVKGANDRLTPADIDAAEDVLRAADCVVLQLEIPLPTVYHTLRLARRLGVRSILNPAPGQPLDMAELAYADYVIPNETEAEALSGMAVGSLDEARACARSLEQRGARGVIVTLGANGALFRNEHIEPHRVNPVDTTGAGDAFIGAFATFLAGGDGEAESIRKANVYAALSTLGIGTQSAFVTRERFEEVVTSSRR
jgi:ribokinase